jgi:hypothetical protein
LPNVDEYVVKPKNGADSIGLKYLSKNELYEENLENSLIQPMVDFEYEISFYFIGHKLEYPCMPLIKIKDGNYMNMIVQVRILNLQKNSSNGTILNMVFKGLMPAGLRMEDCYWWNWRT